MQASKGGGRGGRYAPDRLPRGEAPLNVLELGWATWPILHRMSLSYPETPTDEQRTRMGSLIKGFSMVYPCKTCRSDFKDKIREHPPQLESRQKLVLWFCEQHNMVNAKLGKAEFKCSVRRLELLYGRESIR